MVRPGAPSRQRLAGKIWQRCVAPSRVASRDVAFSAAIGETRSNWLFRNPAFCASLVAHPSASRAPISGRTCLQTVRVVCAHDCPDMCSMLAHVENGRVMRIQGDPANPLTAVYACAKVNRDHELVHSPRRLATPLRRVGVKGEGKFAPMTWDEALDEIVARWKAIMAQSGPLALLGYAYSAHQGQMNR